MGRNFALLLFLMYAFFLILLSRKRLLSRVRKKGMRRALSGFFGFLFFGKLKSAFPSGLYLLHTVNTAACLSLWGLHLLLGWFSPVFGVLFLPDVLLILSASFEISALTLGENMARYGRPFLWYAADPQGKKPFVSTPVEAIFYAVIPLVMVIGTFLL